MYDGRVVFEIDAETKNFDNQIEKVEEELNDLLNRYEETQQMSPFKGKDEDLRSLGFEIEKTANKLKNLKNQQKALNEETNKTGISFDKAFKNGLKSVKKLALGIIGVRSAYMLARKAASAYMAQDEELTQKMQSAWVGLGAFLEPFLTFVADATMKLVGYLNVFVTALTGIDFIARANAKALEKQTKAQAGLNNEMKKYQQYDFDVIRTQQETSTSNYGSTSAELKPLFEMPELNEKIVQKLQNLAKWLKENKDLIEGVGIALGITFGAVAIANLLGNIAALIGSSAAFTGILGLAAALGLVAIVWSVKLVVDGLKEFEEAEAIALGLAENLTTIQEKLFPKIEENPDPKILSDNMQGVLDINDYYRTWQSVWNDPLLFFKDTDLLGLWSTDLVKEEKEQRKALINVLNLYIKLGKQGDLTGEMFEELTDFIIDHHEELWALMQDVDGVTLNYKDLEDVLEDYGNKYPQIKAKIIDCRVNATKSIKSVNEGVTTATEKVINYKKALDTIPEEEKTKIKVLIDTAENEIAKIITSIIGIPKEAITTVTAATSQAKTNIDEILKALYLIPKEEKTTLVIDINKDNAEWKLRELVNNLNATGLMTNAFGILGKAMHIPGFASGGYVSQPTLAVVGEGRSRGEYMIPDNEDYLSRLASEIGQYSGSRVTNVYLDSRLIQRQIENKTKEIKFTQNR